MEKITADHPLSHSADIVKQNIDTLKALFPTIVKEGKVDMEELKALLGDELETSDEYYRFTWAGKAMARREANKPTTATLRPDKTESKGWDATKNIFIEGDNLEVLKLLQKSYANAVKTIYIDPPYNTGKDFVYKDNYSDNLGNYFKQTKQTGEEGQKLSTNTESDGRFHSNWLNMIYPRLKLARTLLKDDGVIFVSIDDKEFANLKKLCEDIFGEGNFVGTLIIQTATDNNPTQINTEHEYILCYAKNKEQLGDWFGKSKAAEKIYNKYKDLKEKYRDNIAVIQSELRLWIKENKEDLPRVTHYDNVDEKGVFHDGDIANTVFGGYSYEVIHPVTGKPCKIPDKGFRFPQETMKKMIAENDVMFGVDETTLIKPKKRVEDAKDMLRSIIYEDGRTSTKVVDSLVGRSVFDNPKSHFILSRLIGFVTKDDDIVIDFFAGSGSTAHAVMQLNNEDGGTRRWITVQWPEPVDKKSEAAKAGYSNIAQITRVRIDMAGELINKEVKTDLFKAGKRLDVGFRYFRLDGSNINAWDGNPENLEANLFNAQNNIKDGRTEEDVLYEILLKYSMDLTVPIEEKKVADMTVYNVGAGALFVCLADGITTDVAEGIAQWKQELNPTSCKVIFKDTGFTDVAKANAMQILKRHGITDVNTI